MVAIFITTRRLLGYCFKEIPAAVGKAPAPDDLLEPVRIYIISTWEISPSNPAQLSRYAGASGLKCVRTLRPGCRWSVSLQSPSRKGYHPHSRIGTVTSSNSCTWIIGASVLLRIGRWDVIGFREYLQVPVS